MCRINFLPGAAGGEMAAARAKPMAVSDKEGLLDPVGVVPALEEGVGFLPRAFRERACGEHLGMDGDRPSRQEEDQR